MVHNERYLEGVEMGLKKIEQIHNKIVEGIHKGDLWLMLKVM
jgi:hypothetical protein